MTQRQFTASAAGPVVVSTSVLGIGGHITVTASTTCTHASVTVRTADETGPAAEAVRNADLGVEDGRLVARVTGEDHGSGITQSVFTRGGRTTVIQSGNVFSGNVTGMIVVNGKVITGDSGTVTVAPVEIEVTVPAGSSVIAQGDSAGLATTGDLVQVSADMQSGGVDVERATVVRAKTMSGRIVARGADQLWAETMSGRIVARVAGVAQLHSMSGRIEAHAASGGHISADTMSGRVEITASSQAIAEGLRVNAKSMSGRVDVPAGCIS